MCCVLIRFVCFFCLKRNLKQNVEEKKFFEEKKALDEKNHDELFLRKHKSRKDTADKRYTKKKKDDDDDRKMI